MLLLFSLPAQASIVQGDIAYRNYRDFAENKGVFLPGATGINILDHNGNSVGNLGDVPMIDFQGVDNIAITGLIGTQYIASVQHNGGYQTISYYPGGKAYTLVDRNNLAEGRNGNPDEAISDFHAPRLNKLVTEATPYRIIDNDADLSDTERFPAFYRTGSGTQYIENRDGKSDRLSGGYSYTTGGKVSNLVRATPDEIRFTTYTQPYFSDSLLNTEARAGDSGSPLFAYDKKYDEWVYLGALHGGTNYHTIWMSLLGHHNIIENVMQEDEGETIKLSNNLLEMTGEGNLPNGAGYQYKLGGKTILGSDITAGDNAAALNAGKNLHIEGDGTVKLTTDVNLGAGALNLSGKQQFIGENENIYFVGAGLDIAEGSEVTWGLKGYEGDALHKIGKGTLIINGTGVNKGDASFGDGLIILDQQADANGQRQAFNEVEITSGRAKVQLQSSDQISGDNLKFGVRGGELDLNGNNLSADRLKAFDIGAKITNESSKESIINIQAGARLQEEFDSGKKKIYDWSERTIAEAGSLFYYDQGEDNVSWFTLNFALNSNNAFYFPTLYFPTNHTSNDAWTYILTGTREDAINALVQKEKKQQIYHGQINGNITVNISSPTIFDGAINNANALNATNETVVLQGHPVIHAYNTQNVVNVLNNNGDYSVYTTPVRFEQPDWETRLFQLKETNIKDGYFSIARNANVQIANLNLVSSNANLGTTEVYLDYNDGQGFKQNIVKGLANNLVKSDWATFDGNINLQDSQVNLDKITWTGALQGNQQSIVSLSPDTTWNLTNSSQVGHLNTIGTQGIYLSNAAAHNWSPNTLTVADLTAENSRFTLSVDPRAGLSDRIDITNSVKGGKNQLGLNIVGEADKLTNNITLASAPLNTAKDYFYVPDTEVGFSIYKPNYTVTQQNGRLNWILSRTDVAENQNLETIELDNRGIQGERSERVFLGGFNLENKKATAKSAQIQFQGIYNSANNQWYKRDYSAQEFEFNRSNINIAHNAHLQADSLKITDSTFGIGSAKAYIPNANGQLEVRYINTKADEIPSVTGDIQLTNSSLYLFGGKLVGAVNGNDSSRALIYRTNWTLTGNSNLSNLSGSQSQIALSNADKNWKANRLSVNNLNSNNNTYLLNVNAKTAESDHLEIVNTATGTNNILSINFIDSTASDLGKTIELAAAPKGTSQDYFSVQSQNIGFSKLLPNAKVIENDKTRWVLEKNDALATTTLLNNVSLAQSNTLQLFSAELDKSDSLKLLSLYSNVVDNQELINDARNTINTPTFLFYNNVEQMGKRLGDLRNDDTAGVWAKYQVERNSIDSFAMDTQRVLFGIDKAMGNHRFGLLGETGKGDTKSHASSNDFYYGA